MSTTNHPRLSRLGSLPLLLSIGLLALPVVAQTASQGKTSVTTITVKETVSEEDDSSSESSPSSDENSKERESEITATFGSLAQSGLAGCKTEELSKSAIKELKAECSVWIKDQKTDLKDRYLTGSCVENCKPCGMSLKRCAVDGTVRFVLKN